GAIAAMHFTGMAAIQVPFPIEWSPRHVAAALIVASAGMGAACAANRAFLGIKGWIIPPVLMFLAVCGLHFTAMAAMSITPDMTAAPDPDLIGRQSLAVISAGMTLLLLAAAGGLAAIEVL